MASIVASLFAAAFAGALAAPDEEPAAADEVSPLTLMFRIIPASLWPGTMHHAWVDLLIGPQFMTVEAPGWISGVSAPSRARV